MCGSVRHYCATSLRSPQVSFVLVHSSSPEGLQPAVFLVDPENSKWATPVNEAAERLESGKAAALGAVAGSLAAAAPSLAAGYLLGAADPLPQCAPC